MQCKFLSRANESNFLCLKYIRRKNLATFFSSLDHDYDPKMQSHTQQEASPLPATRTTDTYHLSGRTCSICKTTNWCWLFPVKPQPCDPLLTSAHLRRVRNIFFSAFTGWLLNKFVWECREFSLLLFLNGELIPPHFDFWVPYNQVIHLFLHLDILKFWSMSSPHAKTKSWQAWKAWKQVGTTCYDSHDCLTSQIFWTGCHIIHAVLFTFMPWCSSTTCSLCIYWDCSLYLLYCPAHILLFIQTLACKHVIYTVHTAAILSCMHAISSHCTQGYEWNYNNVQYVSRNTCCIYYLAETKKKHSLWSIVAYNLW